MIKRFKLLADIVASQEVTIGELHGRVLALEAAMRQTPTIGDHVAMGNSIREVVDYHVGKYHAVIGGGHTINNMVVTNEEQDAINFGRAESRGEEESKGILAAAGPEDDMGMVYPMLGPVILIDDRYEQDRRDGPGA